MVAKSFDITVLVGKVCMVNIIHKPSASDPTKIYANIGSVSSVPKGMVVPEQVNKTFILEYGDFDLEKFKKNYIPAKTMPSLEIQLRENFYKQVRKLNAVGAAAK